MNWASLSGNDKLAVYGSVLVIVGGLLSFGLGLGWLALLAAIAMLIIVFLPQMSPNTNLPGAKGSLMLICGLVAGVAAILGILFVLPVLGFYFSGFFGASPLAPIMFFVSVAGGLLMAWAGWQAFQGEGGKFNVGMSSGTGGTGGTATGPSTTTTTTPPPPPDATMAPPAGGTMAPPPGGATTTSTTTTTTERSDMEDRPPA